MKVKFPIRATQRYYDVHYLYVLNILSRRHTIEFAEGLDIDNLRFKCIFDSKEVIFDFADSSADIRPDLRDKCAAYFKFHLREEDRNGNIYPFAPISFYNWDEYNKLSDAIIYTCNGETVLNNQRPYGNATFRRKIVAGILKDVNADSEITDQKTYWNKINDCLVGVFVPGQNNNMLDRGQFQFFGLGACTISPKLPECLPFHHDIMAGKHYIMCKDDYSDLLEKIEWCKSNRERCILIGRFAKELFHNSCTESKLNDWISLKLNE